MSIRWRFLAICCASSLFSAAVTAAAVYVLTDAAVVPGHVIMEAGVVLTLVVCSVGTGYLLAQPLRRRLYDLEEAASIIASGRLHHRVQTMGETDELGRVGEQFNRMGEQIEKQVRVLQQLAEENYRLATEAEQVATLSERQRLARELHDSVSQQLFVLTMLAGTAQRQYEAQAPALSETLQQLATLANESQREMRALLLQLRPVELEGRTLQDAAQAFLAAVADRHHISCRLEYMVPVTLGTHIEEEMFRMLQEAVANVLKHAEASEIRVTIILEHRLLRMTILDNGKGIAEVQELPAGSYGIRAMQERANALGGRCNIFRREQGTAVEVHIPILLDGGTGE